MVTNTHAIALLKTLMASQHHLEGGYMINTGNELGSLQCVVVRNLIFPSSKCPGMVEPVSLLSTGGHDRAL